MTHAEQVSAERLRVVLKYEPDTGKFVWLIRTTNSVHIGDEAGHVTHRGYIKIRVDGRLYLAHRLAWLYVHERWPQETIDHANGCPGDNRITNLREATRSQNQGNKRRQRNNTSGKKGVIWNRECQKWQARIIHLGQCKHLGLFTSIDAAHAAYCAAAEAIHGQFARGQ